MTQPPNDILPRIERLLDAGKKQEARSLLVEYIKANPTSARAWWLMSLAVKEVDRQVDCLQRVLRLDPGNEQARQRLSKLVNQPPVSPQQSPFREISSDEKEKPLGEIPQVVPAWAAPPGDVKPESLSLQSDVEQKSPPPPPVPNGTSTTGTPPRKRQTRWLVLFILMAIFFIFVIASFVGYWWIQQKAGAPSQEQQSSLQKTLSVAQTLTNFPFPTLIPTWTASPTRTPLPVATLTETSTPSLENISTRTPIPPDLIGPLEGLFPPDFNLTALPSGQQVSLYQYMGKPILVFFWATWCPTCIDDIDSIETISQTYKDSGLVVLVIDVAEDSPTVSSFLNTHPLTLPVLLDPDSTVQFDYFVDTIPGYFFIDSGGTIAFIGRGEMTLDDIKIQVDAIVQPQPASTP